MIRIRLGRIAYAIIGALLLLGTSAPAELSFRDRLQQALFARKPAKETGVFAVDLLTGETIFAHDESRSLIPASNAKLWTTAAAIELLGADYEFTTTLDGRGKIRDGAWVGDLRLKGGGDPSISERFFEGRPTAVLEGWAEHLKAKGIRSVTGPLWRPMSPGAWGWSGSRELRRWVSRRRRASGGRPGTSSRPIAP